MGTDNALLKPMQIAVLITAPDFLNERMKVCTMESSSLPSKTFYPACTDSIQKFHSSRHLKN